MSGWAMDHLYYRVEEFADMFLPDLEMRDLMLDLSKVLHDLEWWRSGDYSQDVYEKTLKEFKDKWFKQTRSKRLKAYIDKKLDSTKRELYQMIGEE